ncbi:MAG: 3-isopropylmalate dehydratase small subunit [Alphaproteobacteria bacterium]|nr:3-isopropylmalate dehydratase small subunit [Alphaproteobacteria bacterium]
MTMFTVLEGVAAPLLRENVDTDTVIRIERLVSLEKVDLGHWAFETLRYRKDGSDNPDFVLNQPRYRGARILLAGRNFGCGSSREGAVHAILGMGIRCVIAPSFGDIFFSNCFQNGVLPIVLPQAEIDKLAEEARESAAGGAFAVDLEAQEIRTPGQRTVSFATDPNRRRALLQGLDPIATTLQRDGDIESFQQRDRQARPWIYG